MSSRVMDGFSAVMVGGALLTAIVAMGVAFRAHARALAGGRLEALTDTLTGLGNRRNLLEDLEDALAERGRRHLLVAFDLDGFKAYNDTFGHPAGDALLAKLGRRIEAALPAGARAYRIGGDEFCALVPDHGEGYGPIVEAVRRSLSGGRDGVSASHGAVALPAEAQSPERVLLLADRRMYAAKAGRGMNAGAPREALAEALSGRAAAAGVDPVAELAGRVARRVGLWGEELELVVRAAELREVGMAAIPDAILTKHQPLDEAERALLHRHPLAGERMLAAAEPLGPVAGLVRACDEHFDGSGHPDGLAGEEIPVAARIVAVCEAFLALEADGERGALARVREEAGARFDPEVVEALAATVAPARRPTRAGVAATLVVALLMIALPASALAGTAKVSDDRLEVKASPGQANRLTIETKGDGEDSWLLVKEEGAGATLTAGSGCSAYAPGQVRCTRDADSISVEAGDGADRVSVISWTPATVRGGPGDDTLYGGGGRDTVEGQDGNDTLGGGYGGDTIRGGPGNDTVSYSYFLSPLSVTLDGKANDGIASDRSNVSTDVENVIGGRGNDTLAGNAGTNLLDGGPGRDTLRGEAGDDVLRAREGERDELNCGTGNDDVSADAIDALAGDCEAAVAAPPPLAPAVKPLRLDPDAVRLNRRGVAPVKLRCTGGLAGHCRGTVVLDVAAPAATKKAGAARTGRRRVIGRARFVARRGKLKIVKVQISRHGRRRVIRKRRLRCRASIAVRRADGKVTSVRSVVTLRAPKGAR